MECFACCTECTTLSDFKTSDCDSRLYMAKTRVYLCRQCFTLVASVNLVNSTSDITDHMLPALSLFPNALNDPSDL